MLDSKFILENASRVRDAIKYKKIALDLDKLLSLEEERRKLMQEVEEIQRRRNEHAAQAKQTGKPSPEMIAAGKKIKNSLAQLEPKLKDVETKLNGLLLLVPNVYSDDTPVGDDERDNKELRTVGKIPSFDFTPKSHDEIGKDLDIIDTERGVKVAGFRGYYLKNDLLMLQWALFSFCLQTMRKNGFTMLLTPTMVREMALIGSGHFPSGREEIYAVDDNFLAGTSEPALLAYRAEEMLDRSELPLKYCAFSPCYRREIGSYGKDTKGLYRVHEFWKIEQVVFCENDLAVSMPLFEELLANAEGILQALELPYRVLAICTADMGPGKYKMYDLETWMPSRKSYGETHSCSHLTDWQSRRLHIRYKDASRKTVFPHAMNNTVIASPRILIAILENYQQEDGTVAIPNVLQPYMNGQTVIGRG